MSLHIEIVLSSGRLEIGEVIPESVHETSNFLIIDTYAGERYRINSSLTLYTKTTEKE